MHKLDIILVNNTQCLVLPWPQEMNPSVYYNPQTDVHKKSSKIISSYT